MQELLKFGDARRELLLGETRVPRRLCRLIHNLEDRLVVVEFVK